MWYTVVVVALVVVVGLLLAFATYVLWIGVLGTLTRERFVRCPYCHRRGLTVGGRFHDDGCPATAVDRLEHVWPHDLHLRHH